MNRERRAQFRFKCDHCNQGLLLIITKAQAKRIYQALQAGSAAEVNRLLQLVGGITIKKEEEP